MNGRLNHSIYLLSFGYLFDALVATPSEASDNQDHEMDYGTWDINGKSVPVASTYRIAWRRMAATTGFRTLYPALIPPGAKHVHPVVSAGHPEKLDAVVLTGASLSSILVDFRIRSGGASEIQASQAKLLPVVIDGDFRTVLMETYLRLNCVTDAYEPLWSALTGENWDLQTPIRTPMERQVAQIKIDVIVVLAFGITVEELRRIYRTQFPVMRRYDQESLFDKTDNNSRKKSPESF
ncbi:hypothetical protein [Corynebacterium casei]|uniref:hypothetical protein n=1 Tax=Corynebacterium casei TaxID=160386 RepID=UPI003F9E4081